MATRPRTIQANGPEIRRLRLENRLSVEGLARKAGVVPNTINNAEVSRRIYRSTMETIASTLGVHVDKITLSNRPASGTIDSSPGNLPNGPSGDHRENPLLCEAFLVTKEDFNNLMEISEIKEAATQLALLVFAHLFRRVKGVYQGSVAIAIELEMEAAFELVGMFQDFREIARGVIADTPEGKAYLSGREDRESDLSVVKNMLTIVDATQELRFYTLPDDGEPEPDLQPLIPPDRSAERTDALEAERKRNEDAGVRPAVQRYRRKSVDEPPA